MYIQYPMLGFNLTTFWTLVSSHNYKTRAPTQVRVCLAVDITLDSETRGTCLESSHQQILLNIGKSVTIYLEKTKMKRGQKWPTFVNQVWFQVEVKILILCIC